MIDKFLVPFLAILIASVLVVLMSLVSWVLGRILWNFDSTKNAGFILMAQSGFFSKELPSFCPKDSCSNYCRIWNCPRRR